MPNTGSHGDRQAGDVPYKLEPASGMTYVGTRESMMECLGLVNPDAVKAEESVEAEARRLVGADGEAGPRQNSYGHPLDDFAGTAQMWNGLLLGKLTAPITPEEVAMMMVCLKLRRQTHQQKRDNVVDGIGYLICLDRVVKERERRGV